MSGFYQKPSLDLLYDLINKDNPDLPFPATPETLKLHQGPFVVDPATNRGRNTRVVFTAVAGGGYRGLVTLYYNRIDLGNLFKDVPVSITHYTATTIVALLPMFNSVYGMALSQNEVTNNSWSNNANNIQQKVVFQIRDTTASLAFIGRIPDFTWIRGEPDVATIAKVSDVKLPFIEQYPLEENSIDFVQYMRGYDDSEWMANWVARVQNAAQSDFIAMADRLREITGDPWVYSTNPSNFNLYGSTAVLTNYTAVLNDPENTNSQYNTETNYMVVFTLHTTYCLTAAKSKNPLNAPNRFAIGINR
jgi:hypothetical protein